MFGLGTIINTGAIIVGGLIGLAAGKGIKAEKQQAFETACGVSVISTRPLASTSMLSSACFQL